MIKIINVKLKPHFKILLLLLCCITKMLNPITLGRNAELSQIGTNDEDCEEETTNGEDWMFERMINRTWVFYC